MLDLNDAGALADTFRKHDVDDLVDLFAKFPESNPAAAEEWEQHGRRRQEQGNTGVGERGHSSALETRYVKTSDIKKAVEVENWMCCGRLASNGWVRGAISIVPTRIMVANPTGAGTSKSTSPSVPASARNGVRRRRTVSSTW